MRHEFQSAPLPPPQELACSNIWLASVRNARALGLKMRVLRQIVLRSRSIFKSVIANCTSAPDANSSPTVCREVHVTECPRRSRRLIAYALPMESFVASLRPCVA